MEFRNTWLITFLLSWISCCNEYADEILLCSFNIGFQIKIRVIKIWRRYIFWNINSVLWFRFQLTFTKVGIQRYSERFLVDISVIRSMSAKLHEKVNNFFRNSNSYLLLQDFRNQILPFLEFPEHHLIINTHFQIWLVMQE